MGNNAGLEYWSPEPPNMMIYAAVSLDKITVKDGFIRIYFGDEHSIIEEQFNPLLTLEQIKNYFTSNHCENSTNHQYYLVQMKPYTSSITSSSIHIVHDYNHRNENTQTLAEYLNEICDKPG